MKKLCLYYLTLLATCAMTFAQSDLASVNGVVRDPSGAVIPDAKISLRNEATAVELKDGNECGRQLQHYQRSRRDIHAHRRGQRFQTLRAEPQYRCIQCHGDD